MEYITQSNDVDDDQGTFFEEKGEEKKKEKKDTYIYIYIYISIYSSQIYMI